MVALCIGIAAIIGTVLSERMYADRVLESESSWALFISAGIISWGVMLLPYLVFDSFDLSVFRARKPTVSIVG